MNLSFRYVSLLSKVNGNVFKSIINIGHNWKYNSSIYSRILPLERNTENSILKASTPKLQLVNGMKTKAKVQRRCPDCYLVWRQSRLYNLCKTKPRHNQMQILPKKKDTWILTFASRKPKRDW